LLARNIPKVARIIYVYFILFIYLTLFIYLFIFIYLLLIYYLFLFIYFIYLIIHSFIQKWSPQSTLTFSMERQTLQKHFLWNAKLCKNTFRLSGRLSPP